MISLCMREARPHRARCRKSAGARRLVVETADGRQAAVDAARGLEPSKPLTDCCEDVVSCALKCISLGAAAAATGWLLRGMHCRGCKHVGSLAFTQADLPTFEGLS